MPYKVNNNMLKYHLYIIVLTAAFAVIMDPVVEKTTTPNSSLSTTFWIFDLT